MKLQSVWPLRWLVVVYQQDIEILCKIAAYSMVPCSLMFLFLFYFLINDIDCFYDNFLLKLIATTCRK